MTTDNFKTDKNNFLVDFSCEKISFSTKNTINFDDLKTENKRLLYLKSRKESFLHTIYNSNPWEDLMIGFQTKILRSPNIYNFKFWYHFNNIYIKSKKKESQKIVFL